MLAVILLTASSLFWSGNFFFGKVAHITDLSPFKLSFFRWSLALLLLLPFTLKSILENLNYFKENFLLMTTLSILSVTIFNSFTYISLQTTLVLNSTIMASTAPVIMIGFSWLIFRTKITKLQLIGIILSLLGALAIILKGNLNNLYTLNFTIGDIWMFAAVISWCLYSVLLKKMDTSIPQLASLEVMIIIGLFFIIPFYLFESFNGTFLLSSSYDFFIIIYVAIFASIAAYFAWNKGVYLIGPNRAGLFLHFIPVFAAIWAITFLNESFAIFHIVGVFFIITGIILSNIRFKNEQNSQN